MARAKVNLYLHLTARRADGYHELDSLVVFPDLGDFVEVRPAERWGAAVTGPLASALGELAAADNAAVRAGIALLHAAGRGDAFDIRIEKQIPVGAGLGGGSADAAAVMHMLNDRLRLGFALADLQRIGLSVGADVPACLYGAGAVVSGIGEVVEPAPTPVLHLALTWPAKPLSTAAVFKAIPAGQIRPRPRAFAAWRTDEDFLRMLRTADNDLALAARAQLPDIDAALSALAAEPQCQLARMTGSGSSCFGLFPSATAAAAAARSIRSRQPGWWTSAATTGAA